MPIGWPIKPRPIKPTFVLEAAADSTEVSCTGRSRNWIPNRLYRFGEKCRNAFASRSLGSPGEPALGRSKRSLAGFSREGVRARRRKRWLRREKLGPLVPYLCLTLLRYPNRQLRPRPFLANAQYIDTEFPSGSAFAARAGQNSVPGR